MANSSTKTEQGGVLVSADKTVRVNARIAGTAAAAAAEETYVIQRKAPAIDVGSTRLGPTFDSSFNTNVPIGRNFGDVIDERRPEPSSIAPAASRSAAPPASRTCTWSMAST